MVLLQMLSRKSIPSLPTTSFGFLCFSVHKQVGAVALLQEKPQIHTSVLVALTPPLTEQPIRS